MRIVWAAEEAAREQMHAAALVLAGECWHPGVIGIVASRMVERHGRPCVLVSRSTTAAARAPVAAFRPATSTRARRLLRAPSSLRRPPRWRRASSIDASALHGFRAAFSCAPPPSCARTTCGAASTSTRLCQEALWASAWPRSSSGSRRSGAGNPEPNLLVPAARVTDVRGDGGGAAALALHQSRAAAARARAVAFRTPPARSPPSAMRPLAVGAARARASGTARWSRGSCCARCPPDGAQLRGARASVLGRRGRASSRPIPTAGSGRGRACARCATVSARASRASQAS